MDLAGALSTWTGDVDSGELLTSACAWIAGLSTGFGISNNEHTDKIVEALVNCCSNNLPDLGRTDDLWDKAQEIWIYNQYFNL